MGTVGPPNPEDWYAQAAHAAAHPPRLEAAPDWDPPVAVVHRDPIPFLRIAKEMGELVTQKNAAYGDSFARSGEFLRLLYPKGARPDQYNDLLAFARMFDKFSRIATDEDAFGEDPARDLVGYAILMVAYHEAQKELRRQAKEDSLADTRPGD
jgi:hypothetical protein